MTDVFERLHYWQISGLHPECYLAALSDMDEARDTIAELREELREARELLADAIEDAGEFETEWNKAARAFLAKTQPKGAAE